MKTLTYIFAVIAMFATATVASAQNEAEYIANAELATAFGSAPTCYHTSMVWSEDGETLMGLKKEVHAGAYAIVNGGYDMMSYENPSMSGKTNSFGFEAGLGYELLKKNWPVSLSVEVKGGWYSAQQIEGLKTNGSLNASGAIYVGLLPHSKVRFQVGGGVRYVNSVSQTTKSTVSTSTEVTDEGTVTTTTTTNDSRRWKGNALSLFVEGRISAPIATIKSTKMVNLTTSKGNVVTTKRTTTHEVEAFVGCSWTPTYKVSQQWDKTINSNRNNLRISAGVMVHF